MTAHTHTHTLDMRAEFTVAAAAAAALAVAVAVVVHRRRRASRLAFTEAHSLAALLGAGMLSSSELLEIFIERVERIDKQLNAIVVRDFARARARAASADEAQRRGILWGPLHGLPMTVKEEMAVEGLPRCLGREADAGKVDARTCTAVTRLLDAGAIIFGKTNVPTGCLDWQTYNSVYGATANPWCSTASAGGSSGGSAVAVAAGLTPLCIGGDSAGSIRIPAAFCGVFGLAPTGGLVPTDRADWEAVVYGPIARSAADCELALQVLRGVATTSAPAQIVPTQPATSIAAGNEDDAKVAGGGSTLAGLRVAVWSGERPRDGLRSGLEYGVRASPRLHTRGLLSGGALDPRSPKPSPRYMSGTEI